LFDGSSSGTVRGGGGAGSSSIDATSSLSLGCGDIASATEIETKKAAVRACYEGAIGDKFTKLLGGSDLYVLTVEPTIQANASTTTSVRNTKGPIIGKSTQNGNGAKVEDITQPANTSETTRISPAGSISSMRISVTLDKDNVTADQMVATKSMLGTFVETKRGDPVPVVKMAKFAGNVVDKPKDALADLRANAEAENAAAKTAAEATMITTNEMPRWTMAVMAVLVIAAISAMLVLWRRSSAMAAERKRLEESFNREQRLFEDFAQQNPDDLAADLNALFGAPSAPEPTYRG
ncbi:MAG: hypothetical protein ABI200_06565, partial [Gaiellales bacterium]